ncbi:pollen-specific leucine-rich repeat extensin-like protein 1 [Folsomia candida]|nr:pollen-specific leucine-rich repeat extensin-like protein 1 [Folsomia candida]XP_035704192.1 pollen-specific leucine-rich repeat extensin-like protein 1 [Folsomia candida]
MRMKPVLPPPMKPKVSPPRLPVKLERPSPPVEAECPSLVEVERSSEKSESERLLSESSCSPVDLEGQRSNSSPMESEHSPLSETEFSPTESGRPLFSQPDRSPVVSELRSLLSKIEGFSVKRSPPPLEPERSPPVVERSPTAVERSPSPLERSPPAVERSPPAFEHSPPAVERSPPAFERSPPAVERSPPAVERSPPTFERSPPAVERSSPTFERSPPAVERSPPPVEPEDPSVNSELELLLSEPAGSPMESEDSSVNSPLPMAESSPKEPELPLLLNSEPTVEQPEIYSEEPKLPPVSDSEPPPSPPPAKLRPIAHQEDCEYDEEAFLNKMEESFLTPFILEAELARDIERHEEDWKRTHKKKARKPPALYKRPIKDIANDPVILNYLKEQKELITKYREDYYRRCACEAEEDEEWKQSIEKDEGRKNLTSDEEDLFVEKPMDEDQNKKHILVKTDAEITKMDVCLAGMVIAPYQRLDIFPIMIPHGIPSDAVPSTSAAATRPPVDKKGDDDIPPSKMNQASTALDNINVQLSPESEADDKDMDIEMTTSQEVITSNMAGNPIVPPIADTTPQDKPKNMEAINLDLFGDISISDASDTDL